jgi:hypothetical protein
MQCNRGSMGGDCWGIDLPQTRHPDERRDPGTGAQSVLLLDTGLRRYDGDWVSSRRSNGVTNWASCAENGLRAVPTATQFKFHMRSGQASPMGTGGAGLIRGF